MLIAIRGAGIFLAAKTWLISDSGASLIYILLVRASGSMHAIDSTQSLDNIYHQREFSIIPPSSHQSMDQYKFKFVGTTPFFVTTIMFPTKLLRSRDLQLIVFM